MTKRGFSSLGIVNCKNPHNAGGILRAAGCYKSDLVVFSGPRRIRSFGGLAADTQKAWRHIPSIMAEDVFDAIPFNTIPIAIDLVPDARPLQTFIHPERGFYIFGPEDGTLERSITDRCKHKIYIPTSYCMNLAATVNVVLYDRMVKRGESYMPHIERAA